MDKVVSLAVELRERTSMDKVVSLDLELKKGARMDEVVSLEADLTLEANSKAHYQGQEFKSQGKSQTIHEVVTEIIIFPTVILWLISLKPPRSDQL